MRISSEALANVIKLSDGKIAVETITAQCSIKYVQEDERIVKGEVYAPYIIDSHGEMMLPEDVELMAHRFLIADKNKFIDVMHNNKPIKASVVESYIAKADDPDYTEGAWVMAVKVFDDDIWEQAKSGKLNGYSFEAMVYKYDAEVTYDYVPVHVGFVEENDGHFHAFYVEINKDGRVTGGQTGPGGDDNHSHSILSGTATELSKSHAHRYFLNELPDED
jgi:hypothetical protein